MGSGATGVLAVSLGVLALGVAVAVFMSFSAVRRRLIVLQGREGQQSILESTARAMEEMRALRGEIRELTRNVHAVNEALRSTIRRVAVHRYDAFEDMGGQLSFSAAFLNDHGDGVVISCINGRQETRSYAKPVTKSQSSYNLSPEEQEAIRQALAGVGR